MKIQISTACKGHGRCYTLAPQLLESDDEGFVTIRGGDHNDATPPDPDTYWISIRRFVESLGRLPA